MVKVSKENLRYLCFEGGGGKGVAYLGALEVMEELGIISYVEKQLGEKTVSRLNPEKIKGIAGTSVGSIVSLLLACGYTPKEMQNMLMTNIGVSILDTVEFGKVPTIFSEDYPDTVVQDSRFEDPEKFMKASWNNFLKSDDKKLSDLLDIPANQFQRAGIQFLSLMLKGFLSYESRRSLEKIPKDKEARLAIRELAQSEILNPSLKKILDKPVHSFNSLKYEYGLFLGKAARDLFDSWIEEKSGFKNCTFKQFAEEFDIDLVITSVSANSKEIFYFRNDDRWGDLCVADAVRMSISIPFLFKPVLLKRTGKGIGSVTEDIHLAEFMVDGGVINNLPIHAFDEIDSSILNSSVLGFSLVPFTRAMKSEMDSMGQFVHDLSYILLHNSSNLQIMREEEKDQIIELDTKDVSIFDFKFKEIPEEVRMESRQKTEEYFR